MYLAPFRNQILVGVALLHAVIVELARNRLPLVVQLVEIARPLMMQPEHRPQALVFAQAVVRLVLH